MYVDESLHVPVLNKDGLTEQQPVFNRMFLEHAVSAPSQYDSTCRRMAAHILELQAQLRARDVCWHCKDVLLPERPRCERCPEECDNADCSAEGCAESRDQNT
jgi:hypothetical protein